MKPEHQLIFQAVKINTAQCDLDQMNNLIPLITDWEYLTKLAFQKGLGPLLLKKLPLLPNHSLIPQQTTKTLQQAYFKTFSRSAVLYEHFRKVVEAFAAQGFPVIALKGIYLSEWLYQDIGLRQFSDIDLLVKAEDAAACAGVLSGMGYKTSDMRLSVFVQEHTDIDHLPAMSLNGVSIEIHTKIHKKKYPVQISEIWEKAVPTVINGVSVHVLDLQNLLIHLCLHLDKHFRGGQVSFNGFSDITNILTNYADAIDWEVLTETCCRYGGEQDTFRYILMTHRYMNAPVPEFILQKYANLVKRRDEQLLFSYLESHENSFNMTLNVIDNMKQITGFRNKAKFILDIAFPSKSYMIQRFHIQRSSLYFLYYPYRLFSRLWKI